jgi:hypothetical protein
MFFVESSRAQQVSLTLTKLVGIVSLLLGRGNENLQLLLFTPIFRCAGECL